MTSKVRTISYFSLSLLKSQSGKGSMKANISRHLPQLVGPMMDMNKVTFCCNGWFPLYMYASQIKIEPDVSTQAFRYSPQLSWLPLKMGSSLVHKECACMHVLYVCIHVTSITWSLVYVIQISNSFIPTWKFYSKKAWDKELGFEQTKSDRCWGRIGLQGGRGGGTGYSLVKVAPACPGAAPCCTR